MNLQKMKPIYPFLFELLQYTDAGYSYFQKIELLDFEDVDSIIKNSEFRISDILTSLANIRNYSDLGKTISSLTEKEQFLLDIAIHCAICHAHPETKLVNTLSTNDLYPSVCLYILESFVAFKEYCRKMNLSLWEQIIEYQLNCPEKHAHKFLN